MSASGSSSTMAGAQARTPRRSLRATWCAAGALLAALLGASHSAAAATHHARGASGAASWRQRVAEQIAEREARGMNTVATINSPGAASAAAARTLLQAGAAPALRPYRMAHYSAIAPGERSAAEVDYLLNELLPATSFFLGRSMRVRCRL
jgi:hypothetical protein